MQPELGRDQFRLGVNRIQTHMLRAFHSGLERLVFSLRLATEAADRGTLRDPVARANLRNGHPAALQPRGRVLWRFARSA